MTLQVAVQRGLQINRHECSFTWSVGRTLDVTAETLAFGSKRRAGNVADSVASQEAPPQDSMSVGALLPGRGREVAAKIEIEAEIKPAGEIDSRKPISTFSQVSPAIAWRRIGDSNP